MARESKSEKARQLLDELVGNLTEERQITEAIKSNEKILKELKRRYPEDKWNENDVPNAKTTWWKKRREQEVRLRSAASLPQSAPISTTGFVMYKPQEPPKDTNSFLDQLRAAIAVIGKDALHKLVDSL